MIKINQVKQGHLNKREILDFLELNYRWYSIYDLCEILNINYGSVHNHCQNAVDRGHLEETIFYKHNQNIPRGRHHYRFKR